MNLDFESIRAADPSPFVPPPGYTPVTEANDLLGLLAWCVTAAAIAGLIIVGIQMALQLNRGTPGEGAEHFRGLAVVALACVLGASAGPLVSFFGDLGL
ncbi:hypothetical protein ACWD6L_14930 [Micromonospora profundi]|uniref:Uncharacterized protein n=1 Tax=Micromonospora profundi TaxID=1420889 RepID=A0AAJ6HRV1_9ACTN|nr:MULTISPECIES: hypothetical protein [Micromonospora]NJC11560.1 hypothetical protein [Micromonospora profundi]WLS43465.1 hypothetical protein Q3V37_18870 [Micromonospora profundi]